MNVHALGRSLLVAALAMVLSGCDQDLNTLYGQRAGMGQTSVNGTAVFARLMEQRGNRVSSRSSLTPSLAERADCIVWFPDDFAPPRKEVVEWFERWLQKAPDRTLIYVGRDFDAAPQYWRQAQRIAPPAVRDAFGDKGQLAEAAHQAERRKLRDGASCFWFTVDAQGAQRAVRDVDGPWHSVFDPKQAEFTIAGRLIPNDEFFARFLESQGDPLISITEYGDASRVILVANGSFLLNFALLNPEHRRLASRLIDEVGEDRRVVFLESGSEGPPIRQDDAEPAMSLLDLFAAPPFDAIFVHAALVGALAALSLWPIFGRPREGVRPQAADFSRHVAALGALLERTGDARFAEAAIENFRRRQQDTRRMPVRRGGK